MNNTIHDEAKNAAIALLGLAPTRVEQMKGGVNNVCLKVDSGSASVLAKKYFIHKGDRRDRLNAEFSMLSFLWRNGLRCVPEPLAKDEVRRIGLYRFIEGSRPAAGGIDRADVSRLCELLGDMRRLRNKPGADGLPAGSDAAFRIQDYIDCISARWDVALRCAGSDRAAPAFRDFALRRMSPVFHGLMKASGARMALFGLNPKAELPKHARTLNPADHGFHNAIRRSDGSLVFIDFEYAGWDDPAQMICNALLQPEIPIPARFQKPFLKDILGRLRADESLIPRVRLAYPLLAFKWCLIMLNEFLPVSGERRRFAGADSESRRAAQLQKARSRLGKVEAFLSGDDLAGELESLI